MRFKLEESVGWDYYNSPKLRNIEDKYLPRRGEGETMAEQIVTATAKLVYKYYNDGDVFDNVNSNLPSWANDLSDYANWLYYNAHGTKSILNSIYGMSSKDAYENLLKQLVDLTNTEEYLEPYSKIPKEGSIYECDGPFEFTDGPEE